VKVVILAGGVGTRISEETQVKPKPMVEIGGKPILWHIMKIYAAHGVTEFIVCLGYKGYLIKEYFANYFLHTSDVTFDLAKNAMEVHQRSAEPWRVTLLDTGESTMTGGRLKKTVPYLKEDFCFTYGDGLANVDIRKLIAFHKASGRLATLTAVQPPGAVRRPEPVRRKGEQLPGKAGRRWGVGQRGVFRAFAKSVGVHRWRLDGMGTGAARAAGSGRPAVGLPPYGILAADGYAARQEPTGGALAVWPGAVENLVTR
jgi:glucose-1-phosphate cytidylyltransferase